MEPSLNQSTDQLVNRSTTWQLIRQSLKGEEHDYTAGSLRTAIVLLAVPMILEMGMESVFAVVDIFFVGRLGKEAVNTVILTESFLTILYSAAMAFSIGATALVARRVGEKNKEEASRTAAQAVNFGLIISAVVSLFGMVFAEDVLRAMGASAGVIATGTTYTRIVFGSSVCIVLLFLINGAFRGAGDASMAMRSLWIANGCNIILCPVLIHFFGLPGAAMATATGRGIGVIYQLWHLFRGGGQLQVKRHHFSLHWPVIRSLFSISWVGFVQFFIMSASWIVLARLVASFGNEAAVAGYGVAIRILLFFLLPAWGMANAAATLVGQNLGAGRPDRAEQAVWTTARYNAGFLAGVTLLFLLLAGPIVRLLNSDPEVVAFAETSLRIMACGYIFYGVGMVVGNAFNGAGDTRTPTWINFFGFWVLQIPLAWFLARQTDLGPTGVFIAVPVCETLITVAAVWMFRKGKWKRVQV